MAKAVYMWKFVVSVTMSTAMPRVRGMAAYIVYVCDVLNFSIYVCTATLTVGI